MKRSFVWLFIAFLVADLLVFLWWRHERERKFDVQIAAAAKRYQIDPALVKAVIWQESRFDAQARGRAGEVGLMQVREDAAVEWATSEHLRVFSQTELFNPSKNVMAGTFYLAKLLKRYRQTDNPLPYALADYNAGRTHVLRWNKGAASTNSSVFLTQIDYPTTKTYAESVMKRYQRYRGEFARAG